MVLKDGCQLAWVREQVIWGHIHLIQGLLNAGVSRGKDCGLLGAIAQQSCRNNVVSVPMLGGNEI